MSRVKIFTDVDGVIVVPPTPTFWVGPDSGDFVKIPHVNPDGRQVFVEHQIRWRAKVTDFFAHVNADIVWLTGWRENAVNILNPLWGIPGETFVNWDTVVGDFEEVEKKNVLTKIIGDSREPFVWIDDTATGTITSDDNVFLGDNCLIVKPDPDFGLQDQDLVRIQRFVDINS